MKTRLLVLVLMSFMLCVSRGQAQSLEDWQAANLNRYELNYQRLLGCNKLERDGIMSVTPGFFSQQKTPEVLVVSQCDKNNGIFLFRLVKRQWQKIWQDKSWNPDSAMVSCGKMPRAAKERDVLVCLNDTQWSEGASQELVSFNFERAKAPKFSSIMYLTNNQYPFYPCGVYGVVSQFVRILTSPNRLALTVISKRATSFEDAGYCVLRKNSEDGNLDTYELNWKRQCGFVPDTETIRKLRAITDIIKTEYISKKKNLKCG
jgi:hypothetical protein